MEFKERICEILSEKTQLDFNPDELTIQRGQHGIFCIYFFRGEKETPGKSRVVQKWYIYDMYTCLRTRGLLSGCIVQLGRLHQDLIDKDEISSEEQKDIINCLETSYISKESTPSFSGY